MIDFGANTMATNIRVQGKCKISIPFGNEEELERIMEIFDTLKK